MNEEIDIVSHIETLLDEKLWGQAASELAKMQPADIAEILSRYEIEIQIQLFNDLPDDVKPDVMSELSPESIEAISSTLPSAEVSDIVDEMEPDDAADMLGGLDKETSSQIIEQMDDEAADEVRMLMTYPEDSAGGIMTTDLISMKQSQTVLEALDTIASNEDGEHVYQIYVVDDDKKLVGIVSIWKLLHQRNRNVLLSDIMDVETFAVRTDMDQEEVAHTMSKYDLSVIPVVDASGELLGRITHDDVIEVIQEEAEEDIFMMAGSNDEELGNVSSLKSCAIRLPWLSITLIGGFITTALINIFSKQFSTLILLVAFIPNVMAMGGNTGIQSSVLLVREIASGSARRHSLGQLFLHELRTGALMGLLCGIGIFIWTIVMLEFDSSAATLACSSWYLAAVVGLALFAAMGFAAGFGAMIPILMERLNIDPAVASGPFITVINDIAACLIYYAITALLILPKLG